MSNDYPSLFSPFATRFHIALLMMFGFFCTVSMRINLGMAMVCMIDPSVYLPDNGTMVSNSDTVPICYRDVQKETMEEAGYKGTFLWSPTQQALLFSATFWGAIITVIPAGYLSDRFGPKQLILIAACDYAIVTILTPFLAANSFYAYFIARIIMGLGEGFVMCSLSSLSARWFPPNERSTASSIFTSGNQLAGAFGVFVSAALCATPLGWPAIFYMFGAIAIVWAIAWIMIVENSPNEKVSMSSEERCYINETLMQHHPSASGTRIRRKTIPILAMLTSPPVYAAIFAQFSFNFCQVTMQSYLPTYFEQVLLLDLKKNGFFSAAPFIAQLILKVVLSVISDFLKQRKILKPTISSRIFQSIGAIATMVALIGLAFFVDCSTPKLALSLMMAFAASQAFVIPGAYTSQLSIAPAYTGIITSMSMVFGNLASLFGPNLIGFINKNGTPNEWRLIFIAIATINTLTGAFFFVFGSADIQPWALIASPQTVTVSPAFDMATVPENQKPSVHFSRVGYSQSKPARRRPSSPAEYF